VAHVCCYSMLTSSSCISSRTYHDMLLCQPRVWARNHHDMLLLPVPGKTFLGLQPGVVSTHATLSIIQLFIGLRNCYEEWLMSAATPCLYHPAAFLPAPTMICFCVNHVFGPRTTTTKSFSQTTQLHHKMGCSLHHV